MARNTNKGKGVGGIQKLSMRKKKDAIFNKEVNRKRNDSNKMKNTKSS